METHYLSFILTYKLSQDHLETNFSIVRARRGGGKNPTVSQFKNAYVRILVQVELGGRRGANCVPLDSTTVLHVSSRKARLKVNDPAIDDDIMEDDETLIENHDFSEPLPPLSVYVEDVVEYISGFASRRVAVETKCATCAFALFGITSTSCLLNSKNKGGLLAASDDVLHICLKTESELRRSKANKKMFTTNLLRHQVNVRKSLGAHVFDSLNQHALNCEPFHIEALIKLIIKKYLVVRVCSEVGKSNAEMRKNRCRKRHEKHSQQRGQ